MSDEAGRGSPPPGAADVRTALAVLERISEGLVALDGQWRYTFVNPEAARLLGRTPEALVGRCIWDEFPEAKGQPFHRAYERAMKDQVFVSVEAYDPVIKRWFENRVYPSPEGVTISFREVSDQIRDRLHLEELATQLGTERRWLEQLLDRIPIPLLLIEPGTGSVTVANGAAQQTLGWELLEDERNARGSPSLWYVHPEGGPLSRADWPQSRVARGEVLDAVPFELHTEQGRMVLLCSSTTLPSDHGHQSTIALVFQDVTPLKDLEDQLSRALQERDEFLSVASHELRTPLTSANLQLHSLAKALRKSSQDGLVPTSLLEPKVDGLERSLNRFSKLLQNVLDVSSLHGGRLILEREDVDASDLIAELLARMEGEFARFNCRLSASLEPRVVGHWDRIRLEQVMANLLTNALKYGRGNPIEVSLEADARSARFTVRDQGIGIAPEDQARIFDAFQRAVSTRNYGGLGIGLWIVRQITEALGGTIRVHSAPGEGSTFVVELLRHPEGASRPEGDPAGVAQRQ